MNRLFLLPAAAALIGALSLPAAAGEHFSDYNGCIRYAESHPRQALSEAKDWEYGNGGAAAGHCVSVALIGLHRYSKAAAKLDKLAGAALKNFHTRAGLYDQAGNAWMLARKPKRASRSFSRALKLMPDDVDMRSGRARARAMLHDWYGAEADISHAIQMDNNRADFLSFRAKIRRNLGHKAEAATDIVRALAIYPDYPAALVQRGGMLFDAGDVKGARKDWKKAAQGRGEAAREAKRLLKELGAPRKPIKIQ